MLLSASGLSSSLRRTARVLAFAASLVAPAVARAEARRVLQVPPSAAASPDTALRSRPPVDAASPTATRGELTAALASAERAAVGGSERDRSRASNEAAMLRARLRDGDFRIGDRIGLVFAGDSSVRELTVREGAQIDFPFGVAPLAITGVLRSELTDVVMAHLRRFLRDPDARIFPLQRLSISGAVRAPGVYWVRRDLQLSELVMRAGGPDPGARMDKASVVRGSRAVLDDKSFARASREGRTVEELGFQAGDELRVPARSQRNWTQIGTYAFFGISALTALLALVRSSYQ